MLGRTYEGQDCSIARSLELVGERWTLLIMRDAVVRDVRRFVDFRRSLGIARNVLATRLRLLCDEGLLEQSDGEYRPTPKGRDLLGVLLSLMRWGDRYLSPNGPPAVLEHEDCGGAVTAAARCGECGAEVGAGDVRLVGRARPSP
jgi:DNA-binding HxlR family transcriptional regulator